MKENLPFQELIIKISAKFTGLFGEEFENAIQDSLAEIGLYFKVDAVRLYRLSLQGEVIKFRLAWRNEHLAPLGELPEIHKMKYPELAAHYSKGKTILFNKLDDSPPFPRLRKILKFFGTKAGVGVPIEIASSGVDIFAMDKVLSEHEWSKDIIEQSKAIGKVLLSTMRRREAEIELQDSLDKIRRLKKQLEQENKYFQEERKEEKNLDTIIGKSTSLNYVLKRLEQVAPTNATVLLQSETGTGKELFANALHSASQR
ncbi:MAG: sigma 54-interacting transcriptional regulator, partial [Cyclobacteriaceae bacterium]|nr:sigma 54-interacting transcriptional regulator [Cyclobacteriaceae bacterium]